METNLIHKEIDAGYLPLRLMFEPVFREHNLDSIEEVIKLFYQTGFNHGVKFTVEYNDRKTKKKNT